MRTGRFLHERGNWAWFVTLTFATPTAQASKAIGCLRGWLDALAKRLAGYVLAAYAVENHADHGLHVHALVELPPGSALTTNDGDTLWRHGHAQVRLFDPTLGGAWYLAKLPDAWDLTYGRPTKHAPRTPST